MLKDLVRFNFYLFIFAGLHLPKNTVKLKWPKIYFVYAIITDVMLVANWITLIVNFLAPGIALGARCYSGFTTFATSLTITKVIACHVYTHKFGKYFQMWDELVGIEADLELKEALAKNQRGVQKVAIILFVFMVGPMIPWCALPLIIKILSYVVPTLSESYKFVAIPAQFPFDPLSSPGLEFVSIFQGWSAVIVNSKLMAFDCMIYAIISSYIVQLQCLKERFKNIVKNIIQIGEEESESRRFLLKERKRELSRWVQDHSNVIILCRYFNQFYSPVLLFQFFSNMMILCLNAFVVAAGTITKVDLVFSFAYVMVTCLTLIILCWLGEEVSQQSLTLTQDGFWEINYYFPSDLGISLNIIFERTKVPIKISAFKALHLSIEMFKSIVGTACSYFMFLNQIRKD